MPETIVFSSLKKLTNIRINLKTVSYFSLNYINQSIASGKFADSLKLANISPVWKAKNKKTCHYSLLLSKINERLTFDQLSRHANKLLSNFLGYFKKVHRTHPALFKLLFSWQRELERCCRKVNGFIENLRL